MLFFCSFFLCVFVFCKLGSLVPWSSGPVVLRPCRPPVSLSSGIVSIVVLCFGITKSAFRIQKGSKGLGSSVPRLSNSLLRLFFGPLVSLASWSSRPLVACAPDPCSFALLVLACSPLVPSCPGPLVLYTLRVAVPWSSGPLDTWSPVWL